MSHRHADVDVVIAGFGPNGAALANLLGQCGMTTLVLERELTAYTLPRAVHFDDEVMRLFQTLGLADRVDRKVRYNPGMRFVNADGDLLLDWPRPPGVGDNGWHTSYRFHQPDLEYILRQGVERYKHVSVYAGAEVFAIDGGAEGADVHYTRNNTAHVVHASYVVGCDGGRSTVRRLQGIGIDDFGFRERWLVVDVLLKREIPELGACTIQYCNPVRPSTFVCGPLNRRRWEITLRADEDAEAMSQPESVWPLLADWLSPQDATLERAAVYTFHSMIASQWRCERVFLAGDAAHQMPPFMGQGMCAGMRDVANLGWKLQAHIQDNQNEALLDSYQSERYPHVKAYIDTAISLGHLINSCDTEAGLRTAFDPDAGGNTMKSIAPKLGAGLSVAGDEHAGSLAPQPMLDNGVLLDDVCGYAPLLLTDKRLPYDASLCPGLKVLNSDDHAQLTKVLQQYGAHAVLIRADRYLLGVANTPDQLHALLVATKPFVNKHAIA